MTYSSSYDSNGSNDEVEVQQPAVTQPNTVPRLIMDDEPTVYRLSTDSGEFAEVQDGLPSMMSTNFANWTAGIDYFPGCRTLSEEALDMLNSGDEPIGDFEDRDPRLPCRIAEIGGKDEEAFAAKELKTSLAQTKGLDLNTIREINKNYPGLEIIIEGIQLGTGVVWPDFMGPGNPVYDESNVNRDDEGIPLPQFRLCECINWPYEHGWDYVDYEYNEQYVGKVGSKVLKVRTVPFGSPQSRNNEVNNPGRHQMHSERGNAWFKSQPRKFIYIHPYAEQFEIILGTDTWESGPSSCDILNEYSQIGEGHFTSPGGKNALKRYEQLDDADNITCQIGMRKKKGSANKFFYSVGHTFEDIGGVEGQEYGVNGISGFAVPSPDTTTDGKIGQNYFANVTARYIYTVYRFDTSLREIIAMIAALSAIVGEEEEMEEAMSVSRSTGRNLWRVAAERGVIEKLEGVKFTYGADSHMEVLQFVLESMCRYSTKNKDKEYKDVDWFLDHDKLFMMLEARGELTMLDVYEYVYPRLFLPERLFEWFDEDFFIREYLVYLDGEYESDEEGQRLETKYKKFEFVFWAFANKNASEVQISESDDDFIVGFGNGHSLTFSEYLNYYGGGWFDSCLRSGGQIGAEMSKRADGRVFVNEYTCYRQWYTEAEPEEGYDLRDRETEVLDTFYVGDSDFLVDGELSEEEIDTQYEVDYGYQTPVDAPSRGNTHEFGTPPPATMGVVPDSQSKQIATVEQAAHMNAWDMDGDEPEVRLYPAVAEGVQPNWTDFPDVKTLGTLKFNTKVTYTNEEGKKEPVFSEMDKVYNWWNSNQDHKWGVSVWCGEKKDSLSQADWSLVCSMAAASDGSSGTEQGLTPAEITDRQKYKDYQLVKPGRGLPKNKNKIYIRVSCFGNRRKVQTGKDDAGKPIYETRGANLDVKKFKQDHPQGRPSRVKIWPNTTGFNTPTDEMVNTTSGNTYWASKSNVGTGQAINEWYKLPSDVYNTHFESPLTMHPVKPGRVYELKRVIEGGVTHKYAAPDLSVIWGISQTSPEKDIHDPKTFDKYFKIDRAVLPESIGGDTMVHVKAPNEARYIFFGGHNSGREVKGWQKRGEPWALVNEVPESRYLTGPMYWATQNPNDKNRMPPFNDPRWMEQLNLWVPEGPNGQAAPQLVPGRKYKIHRRPNANETPYDLSVIFVKDDPRALKPRSYAHTDAFRGNNWKNFYTIAESANPPLHGDDFTQEINYFYLTWPEDCQGLMFGAYGHNRPLNDWSTDGEPVIFTIEEVIETKGPDYYADNQTPEGFPPFKDEHWSAPLNPISEFTDAKTGRISRFQSGNRYRITPVKKTDITGMHHAIVWGSETSHNLIKELERHSAEDATSAYTDFYPYNFFKRNRNPSTGEYTEQINDIGDPNNSIVGIDVVARGTKLYFGSNTFRFSYERTLDSWAPGGEEFEVSISDEGPDDIVGPLYWAKGKPELASIKPDGITDFTQPGQIHFGSYWWEEPFNNQWLADARLLPQANPGYVRDEVNPYEDFNRCKMYLWFDEEDLAKYGWGDAKISVYISKKDGFLREDAAANEDTVFRAVTHRGENGEVLDEPVQVVMDTTKHLLTNAQKRFIKNEIRKNGPDWTQSGENCTTDNNCGDKDSEGNALAKYECVAGNCYQASYSRPASVLFLNSNCNTELLGGSIVEIDLGRQAQPIANMGEVYLTFGIYDSNNIGDEESSWSPKGMPFEVEAHLVPEHVGCSYWADAISAEGANNTVGDDNCTIDLLKDDTFTQRYTDSRFDVGIRWFYVDENGNRHEKGSLHESGDIRSGYIKDDWAQFHATKTYSVKLGLGAWGRLTPVLVDEAALAITEAERDRIVGQGRQAQIDWHDQNITYLRDKTLSIYRNQAGQAEQTFTMTRDRLLFCAHTFEQNRADENFMPTSKQCWSSKGEPSFIEVTFDPNAWKGSVYYAGDSSIKRIDDAPGEIDFRNNHWMPPWTAFNTDEINIESGKTYEVSLIPFDVLDDLQKNSKTPTPEQRPVWKDKFSVWFVQDRASKADGNFDRGFYLEPDEISGEEEPIVLDGEFNTTAFRWSAQFRAGSDNMVFGVYRETGNCVHGYFQSETGTDPADNPADICEVKGWNKKGVPSPFYLREVPDPLDKEIEGWAYWADVAPNYVIDWKNKHWTNPLKTVADGRITKHRFYKITATDKLDRNYRYKLWWSDNVDSMKTDKATPPEDYLETVLAIDNRTGAAGPDQAVIKYNSEIIVCAEGKHLFFAAYNVNDKDRLEDWSPNGEPAPVLIEEVDPEGFVMGSVYYAGDRETSEWLPNFRHEHWRRIHQYREVNHVLPVLSDDGNSFTPTQFPAEIVQKGDSYRLWNVGRIKESRDEEYNLYDNWNDFILHPFTSDDRDSMVVGPENRMRWEHASEFPIPKGSPYFDFKEVGGKYMIFGAQDDRPNHKIEDWSQLGNPLAVEIERIGKYSQMKHGPSYWASTQSKKPDFTNAYWLKNLNHFLLTPGNRYHLILKETEKNNGSFTLWYADTFEHTFTQFYQDADYKQYSNIILNYKNEEGGTREVIIEAKGEVLMFGAFSSGRTQMEDWSRDGEPIDIEVIDLGSLEGPGYWADNRAQQDNVPDYGNPHWDELNVWEQNLTRGNSYRLKPGPEMELDYRICAHMDKESLELTTRGRIDAEGIIGPDIPFVDIKHIGTTNFTFGTLNANTIDEVNGITDWNGRGEPVDILVEDLGKVNISGPGYFAESTGSFQVDWGNEKWLSPLNEWKDPSPTGVRVRQGTRYKAKLLTGQKGNVKIWMPVNERVLNTHSTNNASFLDSKVILSVENGSTYPSEAEFTAQSDHIIFGVHGAAGRTFADWSRDGEPVKIELEEVVEDLTNTGPMYWGDTKNNSTHLVTWEVFKDPWWRHPINTVPQSKIKSVVNKGAKITMVGTPKTPPYDLEVWCATDSAVRSPDRSKSEDWEHLGTWKKNQEEFIAEQITTKNMVFTAFNVTDRADNSIEGWSRLGEPLDVKFEEYIDREGPSYWAEDGKPGNATWPFGLPWLGDSYWTKINTVPIGTGLWKFKPLIDGKVDKAPYDMWIWEIEFDSRTFDQDIKNANKWNFVTKLPKGSRSAKTGRVSKQNAMYVIGAKRTLVNKTSWSKKGEPDFVAVTAEKIIQGPMVFAKEKGNQLTPPHGKDLQTQPDFCSRKKGYWWPGFWPQGEGKGIDPDTGLEAEIALNPLFNYEIKLKKGSGNAKTKPGTYYSVWNVHSDVLFYDQNPSMDNNCAAVKAKVKYVGDIGLKDTSPGGKKSAMSANTRKKGSKGPSGGGGSGGRGAPGKKLELGHPLFGYLIFGQYWASTPYKIEDWSPYGHPISIKITKSMGDLITSPWVKILMLILELIKKIPNLISLFKELDILIRQNVSQPMNEWDFTHTGDNLDDGTTTMAQECRWKTASPKYFNTTCDEVNMILLRLLKLRYNGIMINLISEAASNGDASSIWRRMNFMNLTPTFQYGIARQLQGTYENQRTNRVLREYSNDEAIIPRPWGRQEEKFYRLDTRKDFHREKSYFDNRLQWFNPQLCWPIQQRAGHYYKILHGPQYKSASKSVTVGGYLNGEGVYGNIPDTIFFSDGHTFSVGAGDLRAKDVNNATFEIMAGADVRWPNCNGAGIDLTPGSTVTLPTYFYPGLEFDFEYVNYQTMGNSKDFQIQEVLLFFMQDMDDDKAIRYVKMLPEKTSNYVFSDTNKSQSENTLTSAWGQCPSGTKMRLWAQDTSKQMYAGDKLYKISITVTISDKAKGYTAHAFNISNLRPLASEKQVPSNYYAKYPSDLTSDDQPGAWPG